MAEKVVAVGLLTQRDLDVLGSGFRRAFRIDRDEPFADLLRELDRLDQPGPGSASPAKGPFAGQTAAMPAP